MPRPLTARAHGVADHLTSAALLALPRVAGIAGTPSGTLLRLAAVGHLPSGLLADHPLALRRVVPLRAHLALDALGAVLVAASPWVTGTARNGPRHWLPHALFAGGELAVVALTDPDR
jgi:hypothetical protein